MTLARGAALGALALGIVLVAFVLLRGDGGTEYKVRFLTAGQLVKDDDVQIGGRRIGSIREIELTDNNQAEITIEVEKDFAPLHRGTRAVLRATSLSGIANRYIALEPGPNNAPKLEEGDTLPTEETTSIVDLDQLFDTLDEKTREGLQDVIQGFARQYDGRTLDGRRFAADEANRSARYFNPFLSSTDRLIQEVMRDQPTFERFLIDSSRTVTALAERRDDLASLVSNTNATMRAIGDENVALGQALGLLPDTLRKANTTFVNLRAALGDLDALVAESKPVAPRLAPFFRRLRQLVRDAIPTISDLRRLIRERGPNNDAIDLLNKTPRLARVSNTSFPLTVRALRGSTPVVEFIRPYTPEFISWLRDFGQGGANYDANGHYARIQPMFNAFSFADNPAGGSLIPLTPAQRNLGADPALQTGILRRCPGAATQPRPDGSNPFLDQGRLDFADCNPTEIPPGP